MDLSLRPMTSKDVSACGRICFDAFHAIATKHGFPPDFPTPEAATAYFAWRLTRKGTHGVVAEQDGRIVGCRLMDERAPIAGLGPLTIDPAAQDQHLGRRFQEYTLARITERGLLGGRLVQATYHTRSLCLFSKMGFEVRELLGAFEGAPPRRPLPGFEVRAAVAGDADACDSLCARVHGLPRAAEVLEGIQTKLASVVLREGRVTGYASALGLGGHAVGETSGDLQALIGAAQKFIGGGLLVPLADGELLRYCLESGLRMTKPMTLMSIGQYQRPAGAWLPSALF
ncbi:GNAT family N-acetyltransferase [Myxococcaceae bacterium GXIMD 01537]